MSKISAVIIVKNSEALIADCIDTLSFCSEVIVVDDSSTDRTVDVAKHFGAKVYEISSEKNEKLSSFAEKRNYGLKKAGGEWVLFVDSDERVSTELRENILSVIKDDKNTFAAFRLLRKNYYFGKHEWPYIEKLERLFKKDLLKQWAGDLHETPLVKGEIGDLEGFLFHYTHRDISSMVKKTIDWSGVEAKLRYDSKHPKMKGWRFFRVMFTAFYDSYVRQKGYKAGTAGLVESIYQAFSIFITYARLWEMQEKNER